jgi:hypothetical protein
MKPEVHKKTGPMSARFARFGSGQSAPVGSHLLVGHATDVGVAAVGERGGWVATGSSVAQIAAAAIGELNRCGGISRNLLVVLGTAIMQSGHDEFLEASSGPRSMA